MDNPKILVIDSDPKNLQILKESLESADFKVLTTTNGTEAWSMVRSQRPDIVITEVDIPGIDGLQLFKKMQNDPVGSSIPVVFLTNRRDLQDRMKSLRSGVKDYMVKPLHVKEVIARLHMILRRIERIKLEESDPGRKQTGLLDEKSVEDLVENYGVERRSGILTLYDHHNRSGEIFFKEGSVVNARLGNFKAEKAVYQMLPWKRGHFIMTFKEVNVEDSITVSNLGLLLQGFKRLQRREKLLQSLPSLDTIFVKTPIFEKILTKKTISTDALKFIALFDGQRTLNEILLETTYDDLKTLERIVKLKEQGFIAPKDAPLPRLTKPVIKKRRLPQMPPPKPVIKSEKQHQANLPQNPEKTEEEPLLDKKSSKDQEKEIAHKKMHEFEEFKLEFNIKEPLSEIKPDLKPSEESSSDNEKPNLDKLFNIPNENKRVASSAINGKSITREANYDNYENLEHFDFAATCDDLLGEEKDGPRHLFILGSNNQIRNELIRTMTKGKITSKVIDVTQKQSIEKGSVLTPSNRSLEIFGLSTERSFLQMLEQFESRLLGYVILVEASNSSNLSYIGYLINSLKAKLDIPSVIAVYQPPDTNPIPLVFIRYSLNMDEHEQIVTINVSELDSVTHVISQLKPPEYTKSTSQQVQSPS